MRSMQSELTRLGLTAERQEQDARAYQLWLETAVVMQALVTQVTGLA